MQFFIFFVRHPFWSRVVKLTWCRHHNLFQEGRRFFFPSVPGLIQLPIWTSSMQGGPTRVLSTRYSDQIRKYKAARGWDVNALDIQAVQKILLFDNPTKHQRSRCVPTGPDGFHSLLASPLPHFKVSLLCRCIESDVQGLKKEEFVG
jgi:hypothetical protein